MGDTPDSFLLDYECQVEEIKMQLNWEYMYIFYGFVTVTLIGVWIIVYPSLKEQERLKRSRAK